LARLTGRRARARRERVARVYWVADHGARIDRASVAVAVLDLEEAVLVRARAARPIATAAKLLAGTGDAEVAGRTLGLVGAGRSAGLRAGGHACRRDRLSREVREA